MLHPTGFASHPTNQDVDPQRPKQKIKQLKMGFNILLNILSDSPRFHSNILPTSHAPFCIFQIFFINACHGLSAAWTISFLFPLTSYQHPTVIWMVAIIPSTSLSQGLKKNAEQSNRFDDSGATPKSSTSYRLGCNMLLFIFILVYKDFV